jgi:CTP:molybdopterin cytidylyltransferase MocA
MLLRPAQLLGVLAVDMPRVSAHTFRRLREGAVGHDGAFLHDPTGRRQLCGVLTTEALRRVRPDLEGQHGMSLRRLLADLDLAEVAAVGDEARDIDTWADLRDLDE